MNFSSFDFGTFSVMHATGLQFGKTIALFGAGFSIGRNIVKVLRGKIRGSVAIAHVIRDTAIFFGVSYIGGAFAGGAMQMANSATGANIPVNAGAALSATGGNLGETASKLSWAASDLVNRVTNGLFGIMGSAGTSVGGRLTEATADTALSGAVAAIFGTFDAAGKMFGSSVAAAIPSILFGMIIGVIVSFIFDR